MKRILLLCLAFFSVISFHVMAQRTVTGTVTDDTGETLPGVNVLIKGTTTGTQTDLDGNYNLSVEDGATLVFSFVGFETQEVEIGARTTIDISMGGATELQEVVVTAFGVEKSEKAITYAVQDVRGDDINKAREANIVNSLSGTIAGVQVTNSNGNPGSSSRIVLRGASTISGDNQPLFVVDGVPIDNTSFGTGGSFGGYDLPNGASAINPDDVESISVLKGPVAAALYGNRAANGVILVTTKKGDPSGAGKISLSINSSTTFERPLRTPDFQNSYGQGNSSTYFEFVDGANGSGDGTDESWGAPLDAGLEFVQFNNYQGDGTVDGTTPWVSYPDNVRNFYETGRTLSNNVAISGGNVDRSYRLSITNMNQKGMIPNTDFDRWTFNMSSSTKLLKKLEAGFSANYIFEHADNLASVGYSADNPVQQTIWAGRQVDLEALQDWENLPLAPEGTAAAGTPLNWNTRYQNNPFWAQDVNLQGYEKKRLMGNVFLNYQFADWLSGTWRSGVDEYDQLNTNIKSIGSNEATDGFYSEQVRRFTEINHFYMITAQKGFGDFDVSLSVGGNIMSQKRTRIYTGANSLELPDFYNISNLASGATPTLINELVEEKINSVLSTGQVSYRDYLFLDFSLRNDWWSVLPPSNNSYLYPSVSLNAVVTDMVEIAPSVLSYLGLRGGWSEVGSAGGLDPYDIQQSYEFRTTNFGDVPRAFLPAELSNPLIKPETTTGIEFGLAAKLFEGRVSVDVTYYNQVSTDLIVSKEVSPASGFQTAFDNVGEIENKGIEVQLGATLIEAGDFRAGLNVNFATYNNIVKKVDDLEGDDGAVVLGGQWNVDLQAREGLPYGVLFGPGYLRDDNGNIVHRNGLPEYDPDYKVLGDIQPDWTGGASLNLAYKNITLSSLVDVKWGGDIYSMTTTWGRYAGVLEETLLGRENGIVGNGVKQQGEDEDGNPIYVENDVVVTSEAYNKAAYINAVAEGSVFDATYVKLRQVTFGYDFPRKWLAKTPLEAVSISLVGRNLALLYSKVPHIDPESAFSNSDADQGQEFGQVPSARSMGFNVNIKF